MTNTVAGVHLGPDTHANRPAATAVTAGTLYYCSDHDKIYRSDGSSWLDWADLSGGSSDLSGEELDYVQITSAVSITGTAEGSETTVITGTSQSYEAVPTLIEVFTPRLDVAAHASTNAVVVLLYDGATLIGRMGVINNPNTSSASNTPVHLSYRLTPTAATHQYIVKAYRTNNDSPWGAGSGGSGTNLPSFLRISRV